MTSSASGASRPDIRVGDLVKATHREIPEHSATGRVRSVTSDGVHIGALYPGLRSWDFEVLDRPLPPISDELLFGANFAFYAAPGDEFSAPALPRDSAFAHSLRRVINFVRDYDNKNATKENDK